jgi:hypothetical protein
LIWSWCQFYGADGFEKTFAAHKLEKGTFNDDFHTFGMVWNEVGEGMGMVMITRIMGWWWWWCCCC